MRRCTVRNEIATGEITNVIAGTIERVYEEMGSHINEASAHDKALGITRFLKYGIEQDFITDPLKLREHEYRTPPLCRNCR